MTDQRQLRRHRPYFSGWAQAFGEHESRDEPQMGRRWLLGDDRLGLILSRTLRARLCAGDGVTLGGIIADLPTSPAAETARVRAVSNRAHAGSYPLASTAAVVDLGEETVRIGRLQLRQCPRRVINALRDLFDGTEELHLLETYHLIYPSGTRILTFTQKAPLPLIYRELPPALMRSAPRARPIPARTHVAGPVPLPSAVCA
jgi:hypothetical protein